MKIDGAHALVTGGTAGIGQQIAWQLAAAGATVIIVGRNRSAAEETIAACPDRIVWMEADLTRPEAQDALVRDVHDRWPALSILVNNAGLQVNLPPVGIGDGGLMSSFRSEIELNVSATVALSFGLMPLLANQRESAIVNISSGLAIAPKRTAPVYCATKAAVSSFSRALRYRCEDAGTGITVIDVLMPLVDTAMTKGRGTGKISPQTAASAVIKAIERNQPVLHVGKVRLLNMIARVFPGVAGRILRNG